MLGRTSLSYLLRQGFGTGILPCPLPSLPHSHEWLCVLHLFDAGLQINILSAQLHHFGPSETEKFDDSKRRLERGSTRGWGVIRTLARFTMQEESYIQQRCRMILPLLPDMNAARTVNG